MDSAPRQNKGYCPGKELEGLDGLGGIKFSLLTVESLPPLPVQGGLRYLHVSVEGLKKNAQIHRRLLRVIPIVALHHKLLLLQRELEGLITGGAHSP